MDQFVVCESCTILWVLELGADALYFYVGVHDRRLPKICYGFRRHLESACLLKGRIEMKGTISELQISFSR